MRVPDQRLGPRTRKQLPTARRPGGPAPGAGTTGAIGLGRRAAPGVICLVCSLSQNPHTHKTKNGRMDSTKLS
eukprot:2820055-Lingulodinium_polyedra.AAC.1